MRTPILQKLIEEKNLKIYKTILIDECTSIGATVLGNFINGYYPINNLKNFFHYNYYIIYYEIIQNNLVKENNIFQIQELFIINYKNILIENKYVLKDNPIF